MEDHRFVRLDRRPIKNTLYEIGKSNNNKNFIHLYGDLLPQTNSFNSHGAKNAFVCDAMKTTRQLKFPNNCMLYTLKNILIINLKKKHLK